MITISIDGEQLEVPDKAYKLIDKMRNENTAWKEQLDIQVKALQIGNEMLRQVKALLGRIVSGEKVNITLAEVQEYNFHRMEEERTLSFKHGLTGFIYNNWNALCEVKCSCGNLIHYESVRTAHLLICQNCYKEKHA